MAEQLTLDITALVLHSPIHHLLLAHGAHVKSTGEVPTRLLCTGEQRRALVAAAAARLYLHRDRDTGDAYLMGMRIEVQS